MPADVALDAKISAKIHNFVISKLRGTWIHRVAGKLRDLKRRVMRCSEGERFLLQRYARVHGKALNLTNPRNFTEKLFCRMISLNRRQNAHFRQVSDKYTARAYVAGKVGTQHLVNLLWHGEDPQAIPFDILPAEYVIKTNHGSGQIIVVKGKADPTDIIDRLSVWLKHNYYWSCRESQYYHIRPRVMIEENLRSQDGSGPLDYRFWCFGGVPEVIQVDNHAHDINPFFDTKWNQLDLYYREGVAQPPIAKPINLDQMLLIASQLSAGFDFVRVDLYNIDGKIYFGEFTLTPTAGELKLRPESWDSKLGDKWK
jgi:teichuronopeptide biosynthesis TupA-like protein